MPSPPRVAVGLYEGVQAIARLLGWLTSIAALLFMAYLINHWNSTGGAFAAAMVGVGVAMLNDSYEMVAILDHTHGFIRLSPTRVLMHDLFALALTVGGIVLILFSESGPSYGYGSRPALKRGLTDDRDRLMQMSLYLLAAVCGWRFVFAVFGCFNTSRNPRRLRRTRMARQRRQLRIRMAEERRAAESNAV